jgi:hypothetical protein
MQSICLLLTLLCTFIIASNADGWYLTVQDEDSFPPSVRVGSSFIHKNTTHAILYGGYYERIAMYRGENIFYNEIFILDASNPNLLKWTKIDPLGLAAPVPRAFSCVVYSPEEDALFVYGGVSYPSNYSRFSFYSDSWVFSFSTNTWSQLDTVAAPGALTGMGCDYIDRTVIMTHGCLNSILAYKNDTWRWDLATNTWTLLDTSTIRPRARSLTTFKRIPGSNKFILANGQVVVSPIVDSVLTDIWIFDSDTLNWSQSVVNNVPQPSHDSYAEALTSNKWFLMAGGDADGNKTVADTCFPPLQCRVPATPTDTNYFLRLNLEKEEANWEDDEAFERSVPPHRRASIVVLEPYLYLVGGMNWNGKHGIGEMYNPYTWAIQLKKKYFE